MSSSRWRCRTPRKRSTVMSYTATINNHLRPAFDQTDLDHALARPDAFEHYAAGKMQKGFAEDGPEPSRPA